MICVICVLFWGGLTVGRTPCAPTGAALLDGVSAVIRGDLRHLRAILGWTDNRAHAVRPYGVGPVGPVSIRDKVADRPAGATPVEWRL